MPKITLVGAGSAVFSRQLMVDIRFSSLPTPLAALNQAHMAVHELVVTSLLEGDREAAVHSLMLDPLSAAVCSLEEIRRLFDEMYQAQREFIRAFLEERCRRERRPGGPGPLSSSPPACSCRATLAALGWKEEPHPA